MRPFFLHLFIIFCFHAAVGSDSPGTAGMQWSVYSNLPPLPGKDYQPGLAGSFAGVINNRLIIAGGASLPVPLSNMTGALVDNIIYISGIQKKSENSSAGSNFFQMII